MQQFLLLFSTTAMARQKNLLTFFSRHSTKHELPGPLAPTLDFIQIKVRPSGYFHYFFDSKDSKYPLNHWPLQVPGLSGKINRYLLFQHIGNQKKGIGMKRIKGFNACIQPEGTAEFNRTHQAVIRDLFSYHFTDVIIMFTFVFFPDIGMRESVIDKISDDDKGDYS